MEANAKDGDRLALRARAGVRSSHIPIRITGQEFGPTSLSNRDLATKARAWANANLRGRRVLNREQGWAVSIPPSGIGKLFSFIGNRAKLQSVYALDRLIESGSLESSGPPRRAASSDDVFHNLRAFLRIGELEHSVRIVVREARDGQRYYVHYVDETGPASPPRSKRESTGPIDGPEGPTTRNVAAAGDDVQRGDDPNAVREIAPLKVRAARSDRVEA